MWISWLLVVVAVIIGNKTLFKRKNVKVCCLNVFNVLIEIRKAPRTKRNKALGFDI
jgi:hypothetical protein